MKKLNYTWLVLVLAFALGSCKSSTGPSTEEASEKKQFVWNAMNYWYYWQGDVPALADSRSEDEDSFHSYLRSFSDAEQLFNSLLYEEDDFSFFIENYETFQQSQQGKSFQFGYQFGLVREAQGEPEIFGYVQYVLPDEPADNAGLVRGDIFTSVDGTRLTDSNYQDLLLGKSSYELTLGEISNGEISETNQTVNLQAQDITEDPIFVSNVIDTNSTKIGYLMYNSFQANSHQDLNDVFSNFKSQGISELVVDLRYNGGGAGITSQLLASMISGLDSSNVFAEYDFNSKRSNQNRTISFLEEVPIYDSNGQQQSTLELNTVSLNKVYVLTGFGTASASEVLMNGLDPYINVVAVGDTTIGKDEGSYTLYDTPSPPYWDKSAANPTHKNAIQPIVIKVVNSIGGDYPTGLAPDYYVNEIGYLEEGLPPLGNPDEPLLRKAIDQIIGQQQNAKLQQEGLLQVGTPIKDSRDLQPYAKGLYLDEWIKN